jgi:hypothetical protein
MDHETKCTCEAPEGAAHNPDCALALWTPKEKLDPNVQRMAWLMFIECWKHQLTDPPEEMWDASDAYGICLLNAKVVRGCEVEAGSA